MKIYFSDIFGVSAEKLKKYNAVDIALISDIPLFIDPFLLFNSKKPEYQNLHSEIIKYLSFLRKKSSEEDLSKGMFEAWYHFKEVHQTFLGFSETGNKGRGLGQKFAKALNRNLYRVFKDFGKEKVTSGTHLEKLCLIEQGIGKDAISDFTTNLIKWYLLEYTQEFSQKNIDKKFLRTILVPRVRFNYKTESWMDEEFTLPFYEEDYVLLTPRNILTRGDNWINKEDLFSNFADIIPSISNSELRFKVSNYFQSFIPDFPTKKDFENATRGTIQKFPEVFDFYIKQKEDTGDRAVSMSESNVENSESIFIENVREHYPRLAEKTDFEKVSGVTLPETRERISYLKDFIENQDGYQMLYDKQKKPLDNEKYLQLMFRLIWWGSNLSVDREVNNGRGPVDYKISMGAKDSTLVEFKLAKNPQLKRNLLNQVEVYAKANKTEQKVKVILFFSNEEKWRMNKILRETNLQGSDDVVVIDASPKVSASNDNTLF